MAGHHENEAARRGAMYFRKRRRQRRDGRWLHKFGFLLKIAVVLGGENNKVNRKSASSTHCFHSKFPPLEATPMCSE